MPVLGDDFEEGGDGPFDVLQMIGTVILLIAIGGVSMALVCGSSHAGYTVVDTADDDDAAHHAAEDEVEETQDELSAKGDGCYNEVCANCGEQGSDTVKLKNCNAATWSSTAAWAARRRIASCIRRYASSVRQSSRTDSCTVRGVRGRRGGHLPDLHSANTHTNG